jgi:hypothetical protein
MEKLERGRRNLEKLRTISNPRIGRGTLTLWNPTQESKISATLYSNDASLVVQLYEILDAEKQERLLLGIATVYGFNKIIEIASRNVTFKTTSRYIYDAKGLREVAV